MRHFLFTLFLSIAIHPIGAIGADVSASHRAAIEEIVEGRLIAKTFLAGLATGLAGGQNATESTRQRAAIAVSKIDETLVYEKYIELYAKRFTERDAKEVAAFRRTEAGQKSAGHESY